MQNSDSKHTQPPTTSRRGAGLIHILRVFGWVQYDLPIKGRKPVNPLRIDHTVTCCGNEQPFNEEFFYALLDTVSQHTRQLSSRDSAVHLENHKAIMSAIDFVTERSNSSLTSGPDKSDTWVVKNFSIHSHNERCIELNCDWAALEPSNPDNMLPSEG